MKQVNWTILLSSDVMSGRDKSCTTARPLFFENDSVTVGRRPVVISGSDLQIKIGLIPCMVATSLGSRSCKSTAHVIKKTHQRHVQNTQQDEEMFLLENNPVDERSNAATVPYGENVTVPQEPLGF
jgi:hypothetical protein